MDALTDVAETFIEAGYYAEGEAYALRANALYPELEPNATASVLAWSLIRQNRLDQARAVIDRARSHSPRNLMLRIEDGVIDLLEGDLLRVVPDDVVLHVVPAEAHLVVEARVVKVLLVRVQRLAVGSHDGVGDPVEHLFDLVLENHGRKRFLG